MQRRPQVVVLDDWEGALERLGDWSAVRERADIHIHRAPVKGVALVAALEAADVIVLNRDRTPLGAELVDRLPALKYVIFTGPRNARVDYDTLAARGIPVSATEGGPALESTCEHTWALILAWARGLGRRSGAGPLAPVLSGETLGLIGCGRIGSRVAAVGRAFGMKVVTWSPGMTPERAAASGAVAVALDDLLASALVVSLHLVASPATRHLIDREQLAKMRSDALLVNTSRAELIDTDALVAALDERRIAGAALDVVPVEPLPPDDPLRRVDRLTITPHAGFGSERVFEAFARGVVENIEAWLAGGPLPRRSTAPRFKRTDEEHPMKIAVYGAGATGGHLAVRFAQAGHAVGVVARGAQLDAIVRGGLRLEHGDTASVASLQASDSPADLGPQDVVVIAVKSTGLAAVAAQLAPLIGPETLVMFLQNGMTWWYPIALPAAHPPLPKLRIFALAEAFGAVLRTDQVVPGIVYSANEVIAPGVIRNTSLTRNMIEIAALEPAADERVGHLRALLEGAGIKSPPVADIRAAVWLKLIGNASASSIAVVTGNPTAIACDPAIARTFLRIVDECLAVAASCGYPLTDRLDVTRWTKGRSNHKPSLLQDYEQRRPMELDEMVLAPLAFARSQGIATPTLDAVAAIAQRLAIDRGLYASVEP